MSTAQAFKQTNRPATSVTSYVAGRQGNKKKRLRNCFDFFVKWIEMYFRGVSGCYLSKFSGLNVENNNRKRPERRSGTLTKSHAVSP